MKNLIFLLCISISLFGCQFRESNKKDTFLSQSDTLPQANREEIIQDSVKKYTEARTDTYDTSTTLYFPMAFIYEYELDGTHGEFWIYHNPETGQLLFAPDDPMIDFVISDTLGNYYFFGNDGHGAKTAFKQTVEWVNNPQYYDNEESYPISDKYIKIERTGKTKKLRDRMEYDKNIQSSEFIWHFQQISGEQIVYVTEMIPVNFYQIYGFNKLEGDIHLPVLSLDFTGIFGKHQAITHLYAEGLSLELVAYQFNPYYAVAGDYQFAEQRSDGSWKEKPLPLLPN